MKSLSTNQDKIEVPKSIGKWCQHDRKRVENGAQRVPKSRQNQCKFRGLKKFGFVWKVSAQPHRHWDVLKGQETLLDILNEPTDFLHGRSNSFTYSVLPHLSELLERCRNGCKRCHFFRKDSKNIETYF